MLKKVATAIALSTLPFAASAAELVAGAGYANMSFGNGEGNLSVGALVANVGSKYPINENITLVPEVRLGFGITDDTVFGVDVELDTYYGVAVRGQYDTGTGFYVYAVPSFVNAKFSFASEFGSGSEAGWELGLGVGAGYQITDLIAADVSYETVDETDILTFQARFQF